MPEPISIDLHLMRKGYFKQIRQRRKRLICARKLAKVARDESAAFSKQFRRR